ncbi:MAG: glucose sorbosone dehydrogenase [Candidatus Dadabacteria bacterium]|nr:MAG: glucose sorbosone dehydrogenase [Candidatus Dadabacteria bacterium]
MRLILFFSLFFCLFFLNLQLSLADCSSTTISKLRARQNSLITTINTLKSARSKLSARCKNLRSKVRKRANSSSRLKSRLRRCENRLSAKTSALLKKRLKKRRIRKKLARCGEPPSPTPASLKIVPAFSNLTFQSPVDLQHAADSSNRLFVVEQGGKIKVFQNSDTVSSTTTFLDISSLIATGGEKGLLGLAFHPGYAQNGFFYVNYTKKGSGNTVIARYTKDPANPDKALAGSQTVLLEITQPFGNHNGGQLAFGPDGYLYIAVGDGGSAGDPQGNAQNRKTLLGSILRIDVDNTSPGKNYAIPSDNPFKGNSSGFKEEIYAYGLRNPWRISFDPKNGKLYAADVGQDRREEVNIITSGANYGWNIVEGSLCFNPSSGCNKSGLVPPIAEYSHAVGSSITGGYVYRGSRLSGHSGYYFYADFISGVIWELKYNGSSATVRKLFDTDHLISSFGVDQNGELYFMNYVTGKLFSFAPAG